MCFQLSVSFIDDACFQGLDLSGARDDLGRKHLACPCQVIAYRCRKHADGRSLGNLPVA